MAVQSRKTFMHGRSIILGGILLVALGVVGCATIQSTHLQKASLREDREGIAYFLPRGKVQIKATRIDLKEPVKSDETASAESERPNPHQLRAAPNQNTNTAANAATNRYYYQVTITGIIEPDPEYMFVLRPKLSPWASDAMQINVNSQGLLTTVSSTNTDESGEVLVTLAQVAIESFKIAAGGVPTVKLIGDKPLPKEVVVTFSPTDQDEINAAKAALENAQLELRVATNFSKFPKRWTRLPAPDDAPASFDGFFYRPALPFTISLSNAVERSSIRQTVLLPNDAPILSFSPKRSPLVQRVTHVTLENGTLKEVSINKPSSVLAGVKIPLRILQAIVALPTELIQLKFNYSSTNEALLKSQAAELKALKDILEAQRALASARTNQSSAGSTATE